MTYQEAMPWLYGLQWHGIKLGLENISRLLQELHVPIKGRGAPYFIHVAGTNGKGSVCAMLDSILRATGYRTGLFTSPHLVSFRERIRIDGEMISERAAAAWLAEIRELVELWEHPPTFFEVTTALALAHFAHGKAEMAVLETGMGGRLDATNVVQPIVSVITPVAMDHQQWLGENLPTIAYEKAGIIKPGVPVVSAQQDDDVRSLLVHVSSHREAPFHLVMMPMTDVAVALPGSHQRWNAALAAHALEVAQVPLPPHAIEAGLQQVQWPGRFQFYDESLVLDGAHNPASAQRLAQTWQEVFGSDSKATLVMGVMKDKDVRGVCAALAPIADQVVAVAPRSGRALPPEELATVWGEFDIECTVASSVRIALRAVRFAGPRALVTGSLFVVGEALEVLQGGGDGIVSAQ